MVTKPKKEKQKRVVEPLGLDGTFERLSAYYACSRPRFWGRVGHAVEPDSLASVPLRLALKAAAEIARDHGRGPNGWAVVVQRLRRWMHEGKTSQEQVLAVVEALGDVEDAGLSSDEDAVTAELAPVLRRRMQAQAVMLATEEYARRGDFQRVMDLVLRAGTIGDVDISLGTRFGRAAIGEFGQVIERLPTGVEELDQVLGGGMARAALGMVIGASGHGKSMFLVQAAVNAMLQGRNVLYATLELTKGDVLARLCANLLGERTDDIERSPEEMFGRAEDLPGLGLCTVEDFPARATTAQHIRDWTSRVEDQWGQPVHLVVLDYAAKFAMPKKVDGTAAGISAGLGQVFDDLRNWGIERDRREPFWIWTAAQAVRMKEKERKAQKRLRQEDVASSIEMIRSADLVVTLNPTSGEMEEEIAEINYFVAKHRKGKPWVTAGPVPTDMGRSRIAVVARHVAQVIGIHSARDEEEAPF